MAGARGRRELTHRRARYGSEVLAGRRQDRRIGVGDLGDVTAGLEQLGEGRCTVARPSEEVAGFACTERAHLDVRGAASGAQQRRVHELTRQVGGEREQEALAMAGKTVGQVEESADTVRPERKPRADQCVDVFDDDEARPVGILVQQELEHVRLVREESIGVDEVVQVAPVGPLTRQRTQERRLARTGRAVQQDPASERGQIPQGDELREAFGDRRGVVRLDLVPRRRFDPATERGWGLVIKGPEPDRHGVAAGLDGRRGCDHARKDAVGELGDESLLG